MQKESAFIVIYVTLSYSDRPHNTEEVWVYSFKGIVLMDVFVLTLSPVGCEMSFSGDFTSKKCEDAFKRLFGIKENICF